MDIHEQQVGPGVAAEELHTLGHAFEHPDDLDVGRRFAEYGLQVDRCRGLVLDDQCPEHSAGF